MDVTMLVSLLGNVGMRHIFFTEIVLILQSVRTCSDRVLGISCLLLRRLLRLGGEVHPRRGLWHFGDRDLRMRGRQLQRAQHEDGRREEDERRRLRPPPGGRHRLLGGHCRRPRLRLQQPLMGGQRDSERNGCFGKSLPFQLL